MKLLVFVTCTCLNFFLNAQLTRKHNVYFEFGSSEISLSENEKLDLFIKSIEQEFIASIKISGYADDIGPAAINQTISVKRAEALREKINHSSIANTKLITAHGFGSIPLTNQNNADAERKENRRVQLLIDLAPPPPEIELISPPPAPPPPIFNENSEVGEKIELQNILFLPGSSDMFPQSKYELDRLVFYLKKYENIHILIEGHICCQPDGQDGVDNETGLKNLSEARARAVHYFLITKGIDEKRLDFKGMRGNFPLGLGDQRDRRVEIKIVKI